jgi:hypothetical protein
MSGCDVSDLLRYIELKTGFNDNGPAWIGRVRVSRSGQTIYFNGKAFKRRGGGASGNYFDVETGDIYWVSAVKKSGQDRHRAGSGQIMIEAAAVDVYLRETGADKLDPSRFLITHDIQPTDPEKFHLLENEPLE